MNIRLPQQGHKVRNASWTLPNAGILKVNVDGAARGSPGICGIGGILRNAKNEIRGFFSKNTGVGFAFEAEVTAIFRLCHCVINIAFILSSLSVILPWLLDG